MITAALTPTPMITIVEAESPVCSLILSYDGPSNEYRMTMKGTLSHTAVLGQMCLEI